MLVPFGQWLLKTPRHAWFTAGLLAPIPFFGWMSAVILALVTLRRGSRAGALVAIASSLPFIVWMMTHDSTSIYLLFKCVSILMIWVLAGVLRSSRSWYATLVALTLLGCAAVIGTHLVLSDAALFWQQQITLSLQTMLDYAREQNLGVSTIALEAYALLLQEKNVLLYLSSIATGLFVLNVLIGVAVQLIVARYWQAKLFNPDGFGCELHSLQLSPRDNIALVLCSLGAFMQIAIFIDLIPVIMMPFVFVAVCFIYRYTQFKQWPAFAFYCFCLGLAMLAPYSMVFLVALSVFDSVYDLRRRVGLEQL